jgi:hypothetical protein
LNILISGVIRTRRPGIVVQLALFLLGLLATRHDSNVIKQRCLLLLLLFLLLVLVFVAVVAFVDVSHDRLLNP